MGFPIDSKVTTSTSQKSAPRKGPGVPTQQSVPGPSSQDTFTTGSAQADDQTQPLQEQRDKLFALKHRARGQDVGMRRDASGILRAQWNSEVPGTQGESYFASKQHRADAIEFLKGEGDAVNGRILLDPSGISGSMVLIPRLPSIQMPHQGGSTGFRRTNGI